MPVTPIVRSYNMPDADLLQTSDTKLVCIYRDAAEFATRGVDAGRINGFKRARDTFSDFPTDEELSGILTSAAEAKDTKRHALEVGIRRIRNMADIKYKGNGLYKTFGFDDLTHQPDNEMVRVGRRVARVASRLQADLASEGLTAAIIADLDDLTRQFDEAIDSVGAAVDDRDIQTQQRVRYGNELYTKLIDLASIGKSLFEDIDEARYNDYVIYDPEVPKTPSGTPPAI